MSLIPAKQISGGLEVVDPISEAPARVPGETDNAQLAVTDRDVLDALAGIRGTLDEILMLLREQASE